MRSRILRYAVHAFWIPVAVACLAKFGARIMAGELATIPWFWGVALLMMLLSGLLLLYWRPTQIYWRGLERQLQRIGYRPDGQPRSATSTLLRGSQLDDDHYLEAGKSWLREQADFRILWGTYLTSGESLRRGVFVAAVYSVPPQSATRAALPGFSFFTHGNALIGRLESGPFEAGLAAAPKPAIAIRSFEQLAHSLCQTQASASEAHA